MKLMLSFTTKNGTELYGSMRGYAYSAEEMDEDPEFAEEMMSGNYDVPCTRACYKLIRSMQRCGFLKERIRQNLRDSDYSTKEINIALRWSNS